MDGSEGKPECVTSCSWKTAVVMIISFSRWLVMIMQTIKFGWTEWKHSAADFFFFYPELNSIMVLFQKAPYGLSTGYSCYCSV